MTERTQTTSAAQPSNGNANVIDSGLACIVVLAGHYRLAADVAQLRHELALTDRVSGPIDVARAAKSIGLKTKIFHRQQVKDLRSAPMPALVQRKDGSFLIVGGFVDAATGGSPAEANTSDGLVSPAPLERVRIFDPALGGVAVINAEDLWRDWDGTLILVTRRAGLLGGDGAFGFGWFAAVLKRYRRELALVLITSLFIQLLAIITPLLFQIVIDKVLIHNSEATLTVVVVAMVAITCFQSILEFLRTFLLSHTASRVDVELGAGVFNHLLRLPMQYFETRPAGQTVARVRELEQVRQFLTGQALTAGLDVLFAFVVLGILYLYSPLLALIVTLSVPVYMLIAVVLRPMLQSRTEEKFQRNALSQQLLVETVIGAQTVKTSAAEPILQSEWEERLAAYVHTGFRGVVLISIGQNAVQWVNRMLTAIILLFGARAVMRGELTVGGLIAFNMIMGQVTMPVLRLSQLWQDFQQVQISVAKLGDVFNHPQEPRQSSMGNLPAAKGHVVFNEVTFRYSPESRAILDNISLRVEAGQSIGIIGPSGSGKSTFSKLVQRLYSPERGQVLIDGIDIAQVDPTWLRRQIGVVLQENFLFNKTVHENIAFANPALPRAQVIHVARLAGADEFISQLPRGYDTIIEERGANLSGGQRQRIAIARALATNPRILIFDEATSALDYESERAIQQNMRQIAKGRTVLMIAHRLAAVQQCDRIIAIEKGRLIEDGKPEILARTPTSFYARMLRLQSEEMLGSDALSAVAAQDAAQVARRTQQASAPQGEFG